MSTLLECRVCLRRTGQQRRKLDGPPAWRVGNKFHSALYVWRFRPCGER